MKIPLPPVIKDKILPLPHFPAGFQAVIFRNWGLVDKSRIAAVIGTDEETVTREAQARGLDGSAKAQPDWLTKGYITIIRANWHILDYPGICTLLGWDEEKLGYILREDDFLSVKLGNFKPDVVPIRHRALTEEELRQTDTIRFSVLSARDALPPNGQKPFDFAPAFSTAPIGIKNPLFEERFCYSYCALYGDTFLDRELIDASFPDELLLAYKNLGITGLWTHIVLYTVVEFPFAPEYSKGCRERQQGMRYLTEKLARYATVEKFDVTIDTEANLRYMIDYDLGDYCTVTDTELGISLDARLTEIEEDWEEGGMSLVARFGEGYLTVPEYIRRRYG